MFLSGANMSLDKILVLIIGFSGIAFTFWFFLMKKDKEPKNRDH